FVLPPIIYLPIMNLAPPLRAPLLHSVKCRYKYLLPLFPGNHPFSIILFPFLSIKSRFPIGPPEFLHASANKYVLIQALGYSYFPVVVSSQLESFSLGVYFYSIPGYKMSVHRATVSLAVNSGEQSQKSPPPYHGSM